MADDNLLTCLVELSRIVGRPTSSATLIAGLPLIGNNLTADLFPRAAARIDLKAKLRKFPLIKKRSHFTVPIVLLLQNNGACLLLDITGNKTARIITPPNTQAEEIPLEKLDEIYTKQAFIVEPDFRFTAQSSHSAFENNEKNWFWTSIKSLWSAYSEMLIASFLINLFALAVPLFTMNVYDRVVPNRSFETLWVLASGILLVFTFDVLMRTLRSYFIDQAGKVVDIQVSATILEKVMGIRMVERPQSIGAFANTVQSFDSVREFITSTTMTVLVDIPFSMLFILIIGILAGSLVWIPIIMLPLIVIFSLLIQKPLIKYTKLAHRYAAEKQALLFEILSGIEMVKANCAENIMQNRWEQVINLAAQVGMKLRLVVNLNMFISIFVQQLATVLIVIGGVYKISENQLTMGALIACSLLSSRALAPMAQVASLLTRYHQTAVSLQSLDKVMTLPGERPPGHMPLHVDTIRGDIEFRDVMFAYAGRTNPILQNISFKIHAGEHIGIIGRVGSGKSTIAKLILALLQPTAGSIFIDGVDQANLEVSALRKNIGYVPQDITLFYGTLRDNITFGTTHVEDKNILRAIEVSGVDELIKPQLGSYEAQIEEGGKNLSGGQRRIISIARAILMDPPILIFDEPSHSMDNQTETVIKSKLASYIQNKTLILMTHRTSMLSLVERIIIVDNGKIIADGPKDYILQALSEGKITVPKA